MSYPVFCEKCGRRLRRSSIYVICPRQGFFWVLLGMNEGHTIAFAPRDEPLYDGQTGERLPRSDAT
jgi:hypothetical protein